MKQKLPNNDKIRKIKVWFICFLVCFSIPKLIKYVFLFKCFNNGTVIYDKFGRLRCSCKSRTTGAKCEFGN